MLLVPTLVLMLGGHQGVVISALLLGTNNILKTFAYRKTIPWRAVAVLVLLLSAGAYIGATLLTKAPEKLIVLAVLSTFIVTICLERFDCKEKGKIFSPLLAFASGATSGFSGTSGPLKGMAIRNLGLERQYFVGAASVASLFGDLTKTVVYTKANLLTPDALWIVVAAIPLMFIGTFIGVRLNSRVGENVFTILFWLIMFGYSARLISNTL